MPRFQSILVERFREKLKARGSRGLVGLGRSFKIMDDNGSGTLDPYEFNKAITDLNERYSSIEKERDSTINYYHDKEFNLLQVNA